MIKSKNIAAQKKGNCQSVKVILYKSMQRSCSNAKIIFQKKLLFEKFKTSTKLATSSSRKLKQDH